MLIKKKKFFMLDLKYITRFFDISIIYSTNGRRRKFLDFLLISMAVLTITGFFFTFIFIDSLRQARSLSIMYSILSTTLISVIITFIINRFSPLWFSGTIFLVFLSIIFVFISFLRKAGSELYILLFSIPLLISGIIIKPYASFIFATFFSILVMIITKISHTLINPSWLLILYLFAGISWFSSYSMEIAIKKARFIKSELDKRVAARTAELNEMNMQLQKEISDRIFSVNALRESELRFREMADLLPTIICEFGEDMILSYINKLGAEVFGFSSRDLEKGLNFTDTFDLEDKDRIVNDIQNIKHGKKRESEEYTILNRNGDKIIVLIKIAPIYKNCSITGFRSSLNDITQQKNDQARISFFAAKLEENNRELQDFTYVISHHLQEPLRKISVFVDLLKLKYKDQLDEGSVNYLSRIQNAVIRMQLLINDLLTYTGVDSRTQSFKPVSLSQILKEVLLDLQGQIIQTNAKIEFTDLPVIEAGSKLMAQLFEHFIVNALKFHKSGISPVVKIDASIKSGNKTKICELTIEDNGIGIEERYYERIFGIFQRLHSREEYEGTGIGLAVCKKIVDRHKGSIEVESKLGEGTKFTIRLPVKQVT